VVLLCLVTVSRVFSTVFTAVDPAASFKVVFGFLIETGLYFVLVGAGLRSRRTIELVAWSCLAALVVVACLATVERYTGRNLVAMVVPNMSDAPNSVSATFRHRILFGYSMAMGFPLALGLQELADSRWRRRLGWIGVLLLPAASYFGNSRGPWVGCALAGAVVAGLGGHQMRRKVVLLGTMAALVLATRPGVYNTIVNLWQQTFNTDTVKGRSADYRLVLWRVAHSELSRSFGHLLFGYGGYSTEVLDVSKYFDRGAGGLADGLGHTSWDSQYASDFMQYGYIGFGLEVLLYAVVVQTLFRAWRLSVGKHKRFMVACGGALLVFFWAMVTVAIFNPQLKFLFWTLVAVAGRFHFAAVLHARDARLVSRRQAPAPVWAMAPQAQGK
jgi:hypothetical protein